MTSTLFNFRNLTYFFYFFVFFPFLFPNPIVKTDLQPYALVISVIIILYWLKYMTNMAFYDKVQYLFSRFKIYLYIFIFSFLIFFLSGVNIQSLRSLLNYGSVLFIAIAGFLIINTYGLEEKIVKSVILVWLLVAAIQLFVYPYFLHSIVSGFRISISRGVPSLAAEPSFFGIQCGFLLILASKFKSNSLFFMAICLVASIVFAQSTMGIIVVFVFLSAIMLGKSSGVKNITRNILIILFLLSLFATFVLFCLRGSRLHNLVYNILFNFEALLYDQSIIERLSAITFSITESLNNYLLPNGFSMRIMSGFGSIIYELGFVGFILIYKMTKDFSNLCMSNLQRICLGTAFVIVMITAIQLSTPIISFIIGFGVYNYEKEKK